MFLSFLTVAIAAGAFGYYQFTKEPETLEKLSPDLRISSMELYNQFDTDGANAQQAFVGKLIQVNGDVTELITNQDSSITIVLSSDHPIFGVKCRLDPRSDNPEVTVGENVSITGRCMGFNQDVELNPSIIN